MSAAPVCILYTQDPDLARRVKAFLRTMASVRHVTDPNRLEAVLQQNSPAVILMDLRAKDCRDLLDRLERDWLSRWSSLSALLAQSRCGRPSNPPFMRQKICNSIGIVFKPFSDVPSIICD